MLFEAQRHRYRADAKRLAAIHQRSEGGGGGGGGDGGGGGGIEKRPKHSLIYFSCVNR